MGNIFPVSFDLSLNGRDRDLGRMIKIMACRFLEKEQAIYNNRERIKLSILLRCNEQKENVRILVKFYSDSKQCIGTVLSNSITIPEGDRVDVNVSFYLKNLRPDTYFLNFEVVEVGEKGSFISFDNASASEVRLCLLDDYSYPINGDKRAYGFCAFDDSKAEVQC